MKEVEVLYNNCLMEINRNFWPNKISYKDLHLKNRSKNIASEIKQRRMRCAILVLDQ